MSNNWKSIKNPPIILSIFQLKFKRESINGLDEMIINEPIIKKRFPQRKQNLHYNIGFDGTPAPGISTVKTRTDTKITGYMYNSDNNKKKLIIEDGSITFVNEEPYVKWELFKNDVEWCVNTLHDQLTDGVIVRTSLRFVNKFDILNFSEPLDYFSQAISTEVEELYPLNKYSFRLNYTIPDTETLAIINHALEPYQENNVYYFLDIDVLDHEKVKLEVKNIFDKLENIRIIKNNIFFDIVKQKTIDLCN